jgi:glucosamine--fructose-6-phosphate aminotransferase (isomerizing)
MAHTSDVNTLCGQVFSLPELLRRQYYDLEPKIRKLLSTPEIFSVQKILLSGCGDSYAAAMAVRLSFERLTHLPVEVVSAIDLARFYRETYLGFAPNNPLVIALSNSGTPARITEAARRAAGKGAFVLGITGNPASPLGQCVSRILALDIPSFPDAPGTRSYITALLALLLVALRIGEVRGRYTMDHAMAIRQDILDQADVLERMLPYMDREMRELAGSWQHLDAWDFVGAGPDYATAWYGHAKVFEATGQYAMHINSEEWLHLNFFARNPKKIATVVVASSCNEGLSRTIEVIGHMRTLERPLLIVTDRLPQCLDQADLTVALTPASAFVESLPIVQCAPVNLLIGYVMELLRETPGRGCEGPWAFARDGAGIRESEIIMY